MNDHIRELYQEVIIDHNRCPRNCHKIENPTCHAEGFNPLCGDQIDIYLTVDHEKIVEISFTGSGCAISTASASLMTEYLKGKTLDEAKAFFQVIHRTLTDDKSNTTDNLGKMAVLSGVKEFPSRVKCATLAWHTLNAALEHNQITVTTE